MGLNKYFSINNDFSTEIYALQESRVSSMESGVKERKKVVMVSLNGEVVN